MDFDVYWTSLSELTFAEELEYIYKKWNTVEVANFVQLTDDFILKLKREPYIGKTSGRPDVYSFVISRQTTLFYKVYPDSERIDLLLFFNNQQDPQKLLRLL